MKLQKFIALGAFFLCNLALADNLPLSRKCEYVQQPGELDGNKFEENSSKSCWLQYEVHKNYKPSVTVMHSYKYCGQR